MVHIPVHDQYARLPQPLSVPRRDHDVVDQAEPHGTVGERVVPRRARGTEPRAPLDTLLHGADRHAPGGQRGVPAVPAHHGVGVQRASARPREALECVEIGGRVDPLQLVARCGPALDPLDRRRQVG